MKKYRLLIVTLMITSSMCAQVMMEIDGAIQIADSSDPTPDPGTIRWTGNDFKGWNGVNWISLTGNAVVNTVSDVEGNVYRTILIGDQEWMAENLRTSKYPSGNDILHITDDLMWSNASLGAWSWYDNDGPTNDALYGKLYNWHAVNASSGLCPIGWHVPSVSDWNILSDYLEGSAVAGGKMKEEGLSHWASPNTGATNQSGFSGLPGGFRSSEGPFDLLGTVGAWWTSTAVTSDGAWIHTLEHNSLRLSQSISILNTAGLSVRCVKD